jgi:addiction module HigA family antidote
MEYKTRKPMKNPPHPGSIVREAIIDDLGLTITAAADGLGVSRKQLSELVNERAGISPEMAIRLEKGLGSTADHWLRLQLAFDLASARAGEARLRVKKLEPA